jgi:hypothetical protein
VRSDDLRALVADFVNFCGFANIGAIIAYKNEPPEALESLIRDLEAQLGARYNVLAEQLGEHIRRNEEPG